MSQRRTIALMWTGYVSKFVAYGFFALAVAAAANGLDLVLQARRR